MIFNTDVTPNNNLDAVKESKYDLGIAGALMHVYENECNYNAIVKSVGISELKYYQETGKDLFVNEAGAFKKFGSKVVAFFKAVIEKIKAIFKKFAAMMNQFVMKDKDFVKKYKKQVLDNIAGAKDFELKGYTFEGLDAYAAALPKKMNTVPGVTENLSGEGRYGADKSSATEDDKQDRIEKDRGIIAESSEPLDRAEFIEALNNKCYGNDKEKEDITITHAYMTTAFSKIESTKSDIDAANKACKSITDHIQKLIEVYEKMTDKFDKETKDEGDSEEKSTKRANIASSANFWIEVNKEKSNSLTTAFGALTGALKDRNRQYKAFAVKCLSYKKPKNEAATYSDSTVDDIFANVVIR